VITLPESVRRSAPDAPAAAPRPGFRADVQALRAIAVAGVVLYHLWPDRLRGGFVGVDVFYVISGYLITQHLFKEVVRTGRISLTRFWARRIRRLLPAAFVVLAASAVLLLVFMPKVTWSENLQEIAAAALYGENWLLGFHAVDYLAASDSASIVQHYWSLSVEEQFYIVWPLFLLLVVLLAKRLPRVSRATGAIAALTLVTVVSLVVSVVLTARSPAFAFFATPTRAWEFGLGGLVALTPLSTRLAVRPGLQRTLSWLGFAVIAASMLLISKDIPFPGAIALLPTLGVALVLRAEPGEGPWSPNRVAAWRPIQWIGDQSYSIYLWHWPLIIAAPWILKGTTTWPVKLGILAITLLLAWGSKRFVEDPIRTRRSWSLRRWPNYTFVGTAMAATVVFTLVSLFALQSGERAVATSYERSAATDSACFGAAALQHVESCPDAFARPTAAQLAFAASDLGPSQHCQMGRTVTKLTLCDFGDTSNPSRRIVVVGNSHALRLVPALQAYGQSRGWEIVLAAKTDCMGLSTTPVGAQSASDTCPIWTKELQSWLLRTRPDAVVFASHEGAQVYLAGSKATPSEVAQASRNVIASWTAYHQAGIPMLVTGDVPGMRPLSDPECIAKSTATTDPCSLPAASVVKPNLMTTLAAANPSLVASLPLTPMMCDASRCHGVIGGVVVYSDSHHLTDTFSRSMSGYLGSAVQALLPH
jgi:peptidoglycan/LPS O-acetylase OafA/YrhL